MVAELVALVIFVIMFLLIVLDRIPRQWVTLGCGALMLVLVFGVCMHDGGAIWDTLNLSAFGQSTFWYGASESSGGINWSTIVFIAGMMVMVEGMGHVGIFRWLCLKLAKAVHYRTVPLLVCFMVMAAVLSMFIDSITVILFLAAVTAELGRALRFDPVPMILAEIFCANLGGSATMCGDPPNIIIGTSLGLTFFDFLTNTGVVMLICLVATVVYFYFCFRRILRESESQRPTDITYPDAASAITDRRAFIACGAVFLLVVVLLVTHAQTELTVATTGCLDVLAGWISRISGGHTAAMVAIILWLSAVCSAFVDNIPFAATMVPVIQSMSQSQGVDLSVLAWALSIGTDLGGSATPIGASANVVGTSVAAKNGHPVTWGTYCKYCAPATVLVITIAMVYLFVRYL
jgi:Na+/H+ antiporter NhaD/arsenite permease-like protein